MDARRLGLAGIAMLVGLVVAFLLFYEASPIAPATSEISVAVENVGTHDARFELSIARAAGGGVQQWAWEIPAAARQSRTVEVPRAQLVVRVHAQWSAPADSGVGDFSEIADPRDCSVGEIARVAFRVDTTRGVGFRPQATTCE